MPTSPLRALLQPNHVEEGTAANWRLFSKTLLNASGNAIFVVDPSGTVVISNRRVQKALGLFPGSLLPNTFPVLWPHAREVLEKGRRIRRLPLQTDHKSYLARLDPMIYKEAIMGVLGVLEDRTELEKTTRKMLSYQELNRELDAIIASSDDGLWISDTNGTILRINAASERLNRLRAAELFEKAASVNPDDYQAPTLLATIYEGLGRGDKAAEADRRSFAIIEKHRRETGR